MMRFVLTLFLLSVLSLTLDARDQTTQWAVQIAPGVDPTQTASQLGLRNLGPIGSLSGYYLFAGPTTIRTESVRAMRGVLSAQPQQPLRRAPRTVPISDPLFPQQWHLRNTGQNGGVIGADANVMPAWTLGFTGAGVTVASVDDGLWMIHPDLAGNVNPALSYDYAYNDPDPSAGWHGTSVSGVMAADNDGGQCGVGVAYDAQIAGLRIYDNQTETTDASEGGGLSHQPQAIAVYNNSWGPFDDGFTLEGPGPLAAQALQQGATTGRNGLGSIYVWAAGNGGPDDNINADGYANSIYTIAVGATTNFGVASPYSEPGAPMLVNAPSSGGSLNIVTTAGFTSGCTNFFGGTSSAAPVVAGTAALMLQANPNLSYRDVAHLLMRTAFKNDPSHPDWANNGAGYPVNHQYGFGRVNAGAAVSAAQTWLSVPPMIDHTALITAVGTSFTNGTPARNRITLPANFRVERVVAIVNITHPQRAELEINLTSPSGTHSRLLYGRRLDDTPNLIDWPLTSVRHWGESSAGEWRLSVFDVNNNANSGTLNSWQLIVYGTPYLQVPTGVSLAAPSATTLALQWQDNNPGPTRYRIQRRTETGSWTNLITTPPDVTSFTDGTVIPCETYYYRLRALNSLEATAYTTPISGQAGTCINLVQNGGFEAYETLTGAPNGWTITGADRDRVRCTLPYEGACALEFRGGPNEDARFSQTITPVGLGAGDRLRLRAAVSGGNATQVRVRAMITYVDNSSAVIEIAQIGTTNGVYHLQSSELTLTQEVQTIQLLIRHRGTTGRIFVDDVRLETLEVAPYLMP